MELQKLPATTNYNRLPKSDILWLYNHYCQHGHRYTEHPKCFMAECKEGLPKEKVGYLDIETSNFDADFGFCFCYSLRDEDDTEKKRCVTPQEIREFIFDKSVITQFLKDIRGYDRLLGYWSKDRRFDMPFIRSRALFWELEFPTYRDMLFTDVYDLVRGKLKLHRYRMEVACDLLGIPSKEHRLLPDIWMKALTGDKNSLDYIMLHCSEDTKSLRLLHRRLKDFGRQSRLSI